MSWNYYRLGLVEAKLLTHKKNPTFLLPQLRLQQYLTVPSYWVRTHWYASPVPTWWTRPPHPWARPRFGQAILSRLGRALNFFLPQKCIKNHKNANMFDDGAWWTTMNCIRNEINQSHTGQRGHRAVVHSDAKPVARPSPALLRVLQTWNMMEIEHCRRLLRQVGEVMTQVHILQTNAGISLSAVLHSVKELRLLCYDW